MFGIPHSFPKAIRRIIEQNTEFLNTNLYAISSTWKNPFFYLIASKMSAQNMHAILDSDDKTKKYDLNLFILVSSVIISTKFDLF